MLVIRHAQRVAFLETFVSWTIAYLNARSATRQSAPRFFGGRACDEVALRQCVEATCERGLAVGIEDTRLLFRLILIVIEAPPEFLAGAEPARILSDRTRDADHRLDQLAKCPER